MENLDIVDEDDNVIGVATFEEAHSKGCRHRSVNIIVFRNPDLETSLVAQRGQRQEVSSLKLGPSAGGHLKLGEAYLDAALRELREELFYEMTELPSGITLIQLARYKNDSRPTNRENTALFYCVYPGPFSPDPEEIERLYWQDREETWRDMVTNPDKYTQTFRTAMTKLRESRGIINRQYEF